MPEAKDYPVLAHFRLKDPKTGSSVSYDPAGTKGWPGAKDTLTTADAALVEHLKAGAGGHHGPLIGDPPDTKKTTTASKEN